MTAQSRPHVVILGGGFAGLYAALEFEKILARRADFEVTLVNGENFFLFTPMLHEVAASDLDVSHIVNPIRKLLKRVRFFDGDVESIDLAAKSVGVSHGGEHHHHDLAYDHLVLALGSITNFFSLPGLEERALTMRTLGDAIALRNRLIEQLEEADFECSIGQRESLMTVLVAGGGFSGVETVGAVNDFLHEAIRFYPHLSPELLRVVLVHPGEFVLPELGEKLGRYAQAKLAGRGVEVRARSKVASVSDRGVILNDGMQIPTRTVIWTAGTSPHPLAKMLPCRQERGRLIADESLGVEGWPGVWALGDCARVPSPSGAPYPPTAQHALRQGIRVARNIAARLRNEPTRPFLFSTIGQLAAIGRRSGVARIFGVQFSGFVAWWLWRSIYLAKLPRLEKKLRVMLDWSLDLIFSKDLVQFPTSRGVAVSHAEEKEAGSHTGPPTSGRATEQHRIAS